MFGSGLGGREGFGEGDGRNERRQAGKEAHEKRVDDHDDDLIGADLTSCQINPIL